MTPEQLRIRRMNMIEAAKFGRPTHEKFMLFLLKLWLFIGPIAFVALTTTEVAYILTSLVPRGDIADYVITGGALFIDLAMMFVTFGVAIKRRDLAEKRDTGGVVTKREEGEIWLGTIMWLVFATINIISQSAFLLHIIGLSQQSNPTILYVFVASRVAGFILGDASTAFFLARIEGGHLKLIARGEREKGVIYREIAQAEGERKMVEAKAEADILLLQLKVQQEQEDAEFLANLKRQVFASILTQGSPARSRLRLMVQAVPAFVVRTSVLFSRAVISLNLSAPCAQLSARISRSRFRACVLELSTLEERPMQNTAIVGLVSGPCTGRTNRYQYIRLPVRSSEPAEPIT